MSRRILVAGVGNIFFADDGFGVEVARTLASRPPPGVEIGDYGIRGLHLTFRLLDPVDLLLVADAIDRDGAPGTLYTFEPDLAAGQLPERPDAHGMNLAAVFASVETMGGILPRVRIIGCQPAVTDERIGLSPAVAAAIPRAVATIRTLVEHHSPRPATPAWPQPKGVP
jgi:hydrogenase maturation protease